MTESKVQSAVHSFKQGFSCSQAILSTYGEELGLDRALACKLADAFSGGIARLGKACGAVTGALMVIGLKHGRAKASDRKAREKTDELVRELIKRFESRNGSIVCRDLLGCEIDTPEKLKAANEKGLFSTVCTKAVQDAAEILEELL